MALSKPQSLFLTARATLLLLVLVACVQGGSGEEESQQPVVKKNPIAKAPALDKVSVAVDSVASEVEGVAKGIEVVTQTSLESPPDPVAPYVPTVSFGEITPVNGVNQGSFSLAGSCSDDGGGVSLFIGTLEFALECVSSSWNSDNMDLSSLDDNSAISMSLSHTDLGGGVSEVVTASLMKDTSLPSVVITSANDISQNNSTSYAVGGSCIKEGSLVSIAMASLVAEATCVSGAFLTPPFDTSAVGDSSSQGILADVVDLAGNQGLQTSATIVIDRVLPTVTITSAPDVTGANQGNYSVVGTCSENGRDIAVSIGGLSLIAICENSSFVTAPTDISSVGDGSIAVMAQHLDAVGNSFTAHVTVVKQTALPTVTIGSAPDIDASNLTAYSLSGSCSENGTQVTVSMGGGVLVYYPNCSAGTWSVVNTNVSVLSEGAIVITADLDNGVGNNAVQAVANVTKDTQAPVVVITSALNINAQNQTIYQVSGTCSENAQVVNVNIDSLSYNISCSNGGWATGLQDVSSLSEGNLNITADHQNSGGEKATQALVQIEKSTTTPSVSNLSVASTLTNTAVLNWSATEPAGYAIEDFDISFRVQYTSTWLSFADGVSTSAASEVSSLQASTSYEFRVRVVYSGGQTSSWSQIASGETKPDDPIFNSPYKAMNVGGATTAKVVAFEDGTEVTLNDVVIANLNAGETHAFNTSQFDVIDADKPIYTAGRLGNFGAGANGKGNITFNPVAWAGKSFSFNATRFNAQKLPVYAIEDTTVEVYQGSLLLASTSLTAGTGGILSWSVYGSYQVVSTGTILAYHYSGGSGSLYADPKPLLPTHTEIIGIPSSSMRLTADLDATNYNFWHSNSATGSGSLNKSDSIRINPQGVSSQYASGALLLVADKGISGASFADSNGYCASVFLPTNLMKSNYAINTNSDYVAFASKEAGTIDVYSMGQEVGVDTPVTTLTLSQSGGDPSAPFKARIANPLEGYRFVSTVSMAAWYQPNNDTGGADEDETILYGH